MKTLVCQSPRNFEYARASDPEQAKGHAILKTKRIGICGTDLHAFEGTQPFFTYPRILGHELAAEVVSVDGRHGFSVGDVVTIIPYFNCGQCIACRNNKENCCGSIRVFGVHIDGGMAEYISVPSYSLISGQGLSADALALIEPLSIGAHAVRRAAVMPGEFVLVIGAGPIGLGIMEFARLSGAKVIAMDINHQRLAFCREKLNVPHLLDASQGDIHQRLLEITNGDMPTVVIDATGSLRAVNQAFQYLAHTGRFVLVGLQKEVISVSHPEFHKREATLMSSRNATKVDFDWVINSMISGNVNPTTFITHRVAFDNVKTEFDNWLNPASGVVKVIVELP